MKRIRTTLTRSTAAVLLGTGLTVAAPGAHADTWSKRWETTISQDYLTSHGKKWTSQGYKLPNGSRMARGVFSCRGGGQATLTVFNLDTGTKRSKKHSCTGARRHTPVVAYRNGETVKLILKSGKKTKVEAWAGR
ncbi:hypothetical protein ABZ714_22985 [Streptomyces sp. NPDC006798]|uniref:hypothetical protein n=1 Tax=Streptomyces sp. NPDC006798 TaxID=3155462 RepID=UPI0033D59F88